MFKLLLKKKIDHETSKVCARFEEQTARPLEVQREVLFEKLSRDRDTIYGRTHNSAGIKTEKDFQRQLPIVVYSDIEQYIEKIISGESEVLFGRKDKLVMFALTSGSTGKPKYIPITRSYVKEYKRSWKTWGAHVYRDHPRILNKKFLVIVSPSRESRTEMGVPCGAATGLTADSQRGLVKNRYAVPGSVHLIKDINTKYYVIVRLSIERDVGLVMSANPSTLIGIAETGDERKEDIVKDVHDGTLLLNDDIPPNVLKDIHRRLKPNPKRARELSEIVEKADRLLPKDYWPNLIFLSSWKGGPLQPYLERFPEYYGDAPVRDSGLIASEGRMSIPISDDGDGGVLDITSHFYEFIPEDKVDNGGNSTEPHAEALLCNELKEGENYYIVLTTSSGLYRYNISDLIQVEGFHNATPIIRFLNKGKNFSSITGEKLTEYQVVTAVKDASRAMRMNICTFTLFPQWGTPPAYCMLAEESSLGPKESWQDFIEKVDENLMALNMEYETKRKSKRLGPLSLRAIAPGSFERLKAQSIASQEGRSEQYKHVYLMQEINNHPLNDMVPAAEAL